MVGRLSAAAAVGMTSAAIVALATPAHADFLTQVHKGMHYVEATQWPTLAPPSLEAIKALAGTSDRPEACAVAAQTNWEKPTVRLGAVERQVLRKVFGDTVDKVGLVFEAELMAGRSSGGGLACGTLLYLSDKAEPKPTAAWLNTVARLLHRGANPTANEAATTAFLAREWGPWLGKMCGASVGPCTWPAAAQLPANPPIHGKGPCEGSGKQVIKTSPGPTGLFRGGWECSGRNPRLAQDDTITGPIPHGFGALKQGKSLWFGKWKWGKPDGPMFFIGGEGERMYGPVKGGMRLHGTVKLPSALGYTRYVAYVDGKEQDDAWMPLGDASFKGSWKGSLPHEGELKDASGAVYKGRLCKGLPCGKGEFTSKAVTYEGSWRKGQPNGIGSATWPETGNHYMGSWRAGVPEGVGKSWAVNGEGKEEWLWSGTFAKGKRGGKGQLTFDGCTVTGTWVDGKLSGETAFNCGEFEYAGGMMGSVPHGRGALTIKADGSRYRGRFHLGTMVEGMARWRATSEHPLAKILAEAGNAVYPGYTQKRLYYKGKFRGVKPHGNGALFLVAERAGETPVRLVLEGDFDNKTTTGIGTVKACKEVQGATEEDWTRKGCSENWVVDGVKLSKAPSIP